MTMTVFFFLYVCFVLRCTSEMCSASKLDCEMLGNTTLFVLF